MLIAPVTVSHSRAPVNTPNWTVSNHGACHHGPRRRSFGGGREAGIGASIGGSSEDLLPRRGRLPATIAITACVRRSGRYQQIRDVPAGRRWRKRPVLPASNLQPLVDDLAQLPVHPDLVITVAAGTYDTRTPTDETSVFIRPFDDLDVPCASGHASPAIATRVTAARATMNWMYMNILLTKRRSIAADHYHCVPVNLDQCALGSLGHRIHTLLHTSSHSASIHP